MIINHDNISITAGKDQDIITTVKTTTGTINNIVKIIFDGILKNYMDNFSYYCREGFSHIEDSKLNRELNYILDQLKIKYNFIPNIDECNIENEFQRRQTIQKETQKRKGSDDDDDDDDY